MRAWSRTVGTTTAILVLGLVGAPAFASTDADLQPPSRVSIQAIADAGTEGSTTATCRDKAAAKAAAEVARAERKAEREAAKAARAALRESDAKGMERQAPPAKSNKLSKPAKPKHGKPGHAATPDAVRTEGKSDEAHAAHKPRKACTTERTTD